MRVATALSGLRTRLREVREAVPSLMWFYCAFYLLALFLLCFWVPANDWDSITSYLTRIKLEQFGPLREVATYQIQYTFPKFFDYLHAPFLAIGYFETFPTLLLFFAMLAVVVFELPVRARVIALVLVFAAQPILVQATMAKNDLAIAVFGLLAWYAIARLPNTAWYVALCGLPLCALLGTKWHGFFLVAPLGLFLLWKLATTHRPTGGSAAIVGALLPVYYFVSSIRTYVENYLHEGTIVPYNALLMGPGYSFSRVPVNILRFVTTNVVDTFDYVTYPLDLLLNGKVWDLLGVITFGGKTWRFGVAPSLDVSIYGVILLVVLGGGLVYLLRRNLDPAVKVLAATQIFYLGALIVSFPYKSNLWRYELTVYILGLIPAAHVLASLKFPRWTRTAISVYIVGISLTALLFTYEHRLVTFTVNRPDLGGTLIHRSIFADGFDRDLLYFREDLADVEAFKFVRETIRVSDSAIFFNGFVDAHLPYLYPFIKDRNPANTRVVNAWLGQSVAPLLGDGYKFILCFSAEIHDPRYELLKSYPVGSLVSVYRIKRAG